MKEHLYLPKWLTLPCTTSPGALVAWPAHVAEMWQYWKTGKIPAANISQPRTKICSCERFPSINHCSIIAENELLNYALIFYGSILTDSFCLINNTRVDTVNNFTALFLQNNRSCFDKSI